MIKALYITHQAQGQRDNDFCCAAEERRIINAMRNAIVGYHDRSVKITHPYQEAHDLFGIHLLEWSDQFAALYNRMLEIWRMYTPKPTGYIKRTHKEVGYTGWEVGRFIADKEQPPIPTTETLLALFDDVVALYRQQMQEMQVAS